MSTISINCHNCHRDNWLTHEACPLTKVGDTVTFTFVCLLCEQIQAREFCSRTIELIADAGVPVVFMEEGLAAVAPISPPETSTSQEQRNG